MTPQADKAIRLLSGLKSKVGPAELANWVRPNMILTLSGARPYADNMLWSSDQQFLKEWEQSVNRGAEQLKHAGLLWHSTTIRKAPNDQTYGDLELIMKDGLEFVLSRTKLLTPIPPKELKSDSYQDLLRQLMENLYAQDRFKHLADEDLFHVAYGILLGYPDKAIYATLGRMRNQDPFAEPLISADIRGALYYQGPAPTYNYPRSLVNDHEIGGHEKVWSAILKSYYSSDFHKELEKNEQFIDKLQQLGSL